MTNSIREMRDADCIFITGSNTAESHPVISYEVVRAARRGANVIILDPRRIPLVENATLFLQAKPGTDIYIFLAMMHIILREGWENGDFIEERTEGFADFVEVVKLYTPEHASLMSGVPVNLIEKAARIYAHGERVSGESVHGEERGHSAILYAMGITQRSNGTDMVKTLANLAMLCGQIGKPGTGVNPLRGQANVQGACDVGGLVNVYPGYQHVTDDGKRAAIGEKWATADLPGEVGLTIVEAMHGVLEGKVHATYVMGENPMMSDPDTTHVEKALRALDFLVVQDIFPCETAVLAHVILPAASSLEKDGTITNTERRVQRLSPVLPSPGAARQDWEIIAQIAARFDEKMGIERAEGYWEFADSDAIFDELATVTPIYGGMDYRRLTGEGLQWPCPTPDHPGTPILHVDKFARGKGKFHPVKAKDPVELPDDEYPLILTTGRVLYHYHTGTVTRRSGPLHWADEGDYVEINAADAAAIGAADNSAVVIESRRGKVETRVRISEGVPPGTIFLAFHWREASANILTHDIELDPVAKIPEYKICAVRLINPRTKASSPPPNGDARE
jgi:predicted molibdopterin-dependent oxidoreductase YjgC